MEADLFQFEWAVDQDGYEISEVPADTGRLHLLSTRKPYKKICRIGGPWKFYRPLEKEPALARNFATLSQNEPAVLKFVSEFGLLESPRADQQGTEWEKLESIFHKIRDTRQIYHLIGEGLQNEAADLFRKHLRIRLDGYPVMGTKRVPRLEVAPLSLYSFILLQIVQDMSGAKQYGQCRECQKWFPARARKEYCSTRCRTAAHRKKETRK